MANKYTLEPTITDEAWLREKYHEQNLSSYEIADIADCSHDTVCKYMEKFGIDRHDQPTHLAISRKFGRRTSNESDD